MKKNKFKIVLAGSPEIACPAFEELIENFDVVAIVTQNDKPKGRGLEVQSTEVATLGAKHKIKVLKCDKINEVFEELKDLDYDILISFAFGQYIPRKVLDLGRFRPVNIHGSLLPKYRGAAPIHYAILNGDSEIGITLIEMIDQMDAGDMYFKASQPIDSKTTTGDAFAIISNLAKENIVAWINQIFEGKVVPEKQPTEFSLSPKIEKSFAEIHFNMSVQEADRRIYGFNPFPGAFTFINGKRVKLFRTSMQPVPESLVLQFSNGVLYITEYQVEGKKIVNVMSAKTD